MCDAGKTTALSILTGDCQPSDGSVHIAGLDMSDPRTMKLIGYCPQVDPILDLMTGTANYIDIDCSNFNKVICPGPQSRPVLCSGKEILYFFGRIRGLSPDSLKDKVQTLLQQVGLKPFADRLCGRYSGGNKRKLSLALALIGDPKVLFLDEPSTGMDPEARRKVCFAL